MTTRKCPHTAVVSTERESPDKPDTETVTVLAMTF